MENSIEVYPFFKGANPIRPNTRKIMALEGNASSRGWTFLNELHQTPMCKSGRPDLDEIRGASFVIAKVTIEATKPLGLKQAGWYKTDFPLLNYIAI